MDAREVDAHLADLRRRQEAAWPAEMPRETRYPLGERAVTDYLRAHAERDPGHPAIVFYGRVLTYGDLDELSDRFGGWLEARGVRPGDRVGVCLPNCPQFVIAMLGILKLGAVHVPVNPMFREQELRHELADAGVEVLVVQDTVAPLVENVRDGTAVRETLVTAVSDMLPDRPDLPLPRSWTAPGPDAPPSGWAEVERSVRLGRRPADLDAPAALNYTGGTTGLPKGCVHTQRHMLYTAAGSAAGWGVTGPSDVLIIYTPIFWISGENSGVLVPLLTGSTTVLMGRWDPAAVLDAVGRYGATAMSGTVDNYVELMDHPTFSGRDLSTLRHVRAMSFVRKLTPDVRDRWRRAVGAHSVLREGSYGMTESHTSDTFTRGFQEGDADLRSEPVFCGLPVPGTEFMVVDPETGAPRPIGEAGEIWLRTPSALTGYWRAPEATADVLRDGWLRTGDNGRVDGRGCLSYLGRRKEMIKVNGMSVFPAEVESLLGRHPGVRAVAVVPVDDPATGQLPLAHVRPEPDAGLDAASLTAWAREQMAPYKVPRIRIVDELPMTATGKIKKSELAPKEAR
ncbi:AMP-binding protein [Actinomadura sp. WMMB 499]|nr:AMP-binding protein [Actinomadura sp. WMMB 499]